MRHVVIVLVVCLALNGLGCGYNPKFNADIVGLGDLPDQRPSIPPLPDVEDLSKLSAGEPRPAYRIGPLDQVTVLVWGRPDLGSQVPLERESQRKITTVAADGSIALPFLDRLDIAGLTVREATDLIQEAYARSMATPQVEIDIAAYRSQQVRIEGEVTRPGIVFLKDNVMTVSEALKAAGRTTDAADTRHAVLVRDGITYHLDDWTARRGTNDALDVLLQHGDRIYFPAMTERVFYVLGDVLRQGSYPISDQGTTLLEGLAAAGGPNLDSAKLRPITLIRLHGDQSTVYEFKLADAMEAGEVPLFPGDRLYVSRTRIWYWGNVGRQLVPFISLASAAWFIDRLLSE